MTKGWKRSETLEQRFMKFVLKTDSCWLWQGAPASHGYGLLSFKMKRDTAPRWSYQLFKGKIKDEGVICHNCDNRRCVNPAHLFQGTHNDNVQDKIKKGRQPYGKATGHIKLSDDQVKKVIELRGKIGCTALARELKVTHSLISMIWAGKRREKLQKELMYG